MLRRRRRLVERRRRQRSTLSPSVWRRYGHAGGFGGNDPAAIALARMQAMIPSSLSTFLGHSLPSPHHLLLLCPRGFERGRDARAARLSSSGVI